MTILRVGSFGGGVVLEGAAEQRRIDEVAQADSYEVGTRGALIAASDVTNYTTLLDRNGNPIAALHALFSMASLVAAQVVAIGEGISSIAPNPRCYTGTRFSRSGAPNPQPAPFTEQIPDTTVTTTVAVTAAGVVVTSAPFPGVFQAKVGAAPVININVVLVCLGAREGFAPRTAPGLYVAYVGPPSTAIGYWPIIVFDALGTGPYGELPVGGGAAGTMSQQLYPRGIIGYNNHVFAWGFDSADVTNGDGPNRVMFCNLGKPLKWGNDNQAAAGVDRAFTDSDAITLGDAGEIVRGAIKWAGKLWFGTNQQLHYIAGYGRDSFLTDGATPVARAYNIVGPHALIEGPDRQLYGVGDQGLWRTGNGADFEALFRRLIDFDGHSIGYWDLIWTDPARAAAAVPGRTNQDLVWMAVDWERHQVLVGIPWCNAVAGSGPGNDTVVIKFHVLTGGFTRQVFTGVQYTAAGYLRREGQEPSTRFFGTATAAQTTVKRYGYTAAAGDSPRMPAALPVLSCGPYAPYGGEGRGSLKRIYLTLAWESSGALPLVFQVTTTWDEAISDQFLLSVQDSAPAAPTMDDLWLDTSTLNNNIGNSVAGALIPAFPSALLKRWSGSAWDQLPGVGSNGTRATIRLPLTPRNGTRFTVTATCVAAVGRFQMEALGQKPGGGTQAE